MKSLGAKIIYIYLPFLLLAVAMVSVWTLLNWVVFIEYNLFHIKQDIINIWLPFCLPLVPVLLWLRPRIKLMNIEGRNGSLRILYYMACSFAITAPMIIAQEYLTVATGKLTELDNINHINTKPPTKYYTLNNYHIDKSRIGVYHLFETTGKYNENLHMYIYVALPILPGISDTATNNWPAWAVLKYHEEISNRLSDEEKEEKYQEFVEESQKKFEKEKVNEFVYLDRLGNNYATDHYLEAIKNFSGFNGSTDNILQPINEPFEARLGNKFEWIFGSFAIGAGIWLLMLLFPKLDMERFEDFKKGIKESSTDWLEVKEFFIPQEGNFANAIIINLNILVFLVMMFAGLGFVSFKTTDLIEWGANYGPLTKDGQWWRLLTSTFLHGGVIHLFANVYGLMFVGILLEPVLGKGRFVIAYFATGIIASLSSLWWYEDAVSIGASGAIFGMYGVFLAFLLFKVFTPEFTKPFLFATALFIGYNLFIGFAANNGIDNAAHIGGLASGFLIGVLMYLTLKKKKEMDYI